MYVNPPPAGVTWFSGFILHLYSSSLFFIAQYPWLPSWDNRVEKKLASSWVLSPDEEKMLRGKPEVCWMQR